MTQPTRRALLQAAVSSAAPALLSQTRKRNLVFILTDDHRYDFIGALGHPWLRGHTPNLDRLLAGGVHFRNAFVTTSLCSPSRASILTGQYMHAHGVLDNFSPLNPKLPIFPQLLRDSGYRTAFVGKWHMGGDSDEPRPGFDHWVSFRGQGEYTNPEINRNGDRRRIDGYVTDILTQEATRFIGDNAARPFMVYLSHKAIHYPFNPPPRHASLFEGKTVPKPASMIYRKEYYDHLPEWVHRRRYSRHGVDGLFGHTDTFDHAYLGYCQSLLSVDESVGAVISALESKGLLNDTLILYMGDNGYLWGEHGLVDKRSMHEPSIRVPLIAHCPNLLPKGRAVDGMALNLDIAPTCLDAAGLTPPKAMQGASLVPLAQGAARAWRSDFIYEYEWEQDYPYTPTVTGLRTERHSFMQYSGIWDIAELYDIQKDPDQMNNLLRDIRISHERGRLATNIPDPARKQLVDTLQSRLHQLLTETGGDPRRAGKGSAGDRFAL